MRIDQMRARGEPYDEVLRATLSRGWSQQLGRPIDVLDPRAPRGQPWRVQRLLSGYVVPGCSREVRRFLRDGFRFTPIRWRQPLQWLLADALASRAGLAGTTAPGFRVDPGLPHAESLLVVPGNQRVRVFDFEAGTSRVFLKAGFAADTMRTEIAARAGEGPFLPVLGAAEDATWLEEPILEGWALARLPPWLGRRGMEEAALALVRTWLDATSEVTSAKVFAKATHDAVDAGLQALDARFPGVSGGLAELVRRAAGLVASTPEVETARSHGDLQAGNVMVRASDRTPVLIDWEHSARRQRDYDLLVYGLQTRATAGVGERIAQWVRAGSAGRVRGVPDPGGRAARAVQAAWLVLHDVGFYVAESLSGPYGRPSQGIGAYRDAAPAIAAAFEAR